MSGDMNGPPTRIVVLSSLYPNAEQPRHGLFVEERLRCLMATGRVHARVIAPVPWFASTHPRFGRYAQYARIPEREIRHGVSILHPRYAVVPRVGMALSPWTMAFAAARSLRRLRADGFDFDLIDAHYFYPDGVAAARLSKRFDRPLLITASGTDINAIGDYRQARWRIRSAASRAAGLITVSQALAERLVSFGVPANKITTLRNGVDLYRFAPIAQASARARLNVDGPVWLTVGDLIERKGVHFAIEALVSVPDATLLIVGRGPQEQALRDQADTLGVSQRTRFVGHVAQNDLPLYYSAADVLVLASRSEGTPNVVLEAMACGTAVIASALDGISQVLTGLPQGVLLREPSTAAIVAGWQTLQANGLDAPQRKIRRRNARRFSWNQTTAGQLALFERVLSAGRAGGIRASQPALDDDVSAHGGLD